MVASTQIVTGTPVSTVGNPAVGISTNAATATCPTGTKLLGGGANVTQGSGARGAVSGSYPSSGTTWSATAVVTVSSGGTVTITAYAVCGQ